MPIDTDASSEDLAQQYRDAHAAGEKTTYRLIHDLLHQRGDHALIAGVAEQAANEEPEVESTDHDSSEDVETDA